MNAHIPSTFLALALLACACSSRAGEDSPLPPVPVADGKAEGLQPPRPNIGPPPIVVAGGAQGPSNDYPPPPVPPTPPAGVATEYYSTCGGTHPPVRYVYPDYDDYEIDSNGKRTLSAEAKQYFDSPEYKKYAQEVEQYKRDNAARPGTYGSVDGKTGEAVPSTTTPEELSGSTGPATLGGGMQQLYLDRDPKKDLAAWMNGLPYHLPVSGVSYNEPAPELVSSLDSPEAGPALTASDYGRLVKFLTPEAHAEAPNPQALVATVEVLWEQQWRRNLGFDRDPDSKDLAKALEHVKKDIAGTQNQLLDLVKRTEADEVARLQLYEQKSAASKRLKELREKEAALQAEFGQRLDFVRAMVNLLRLAPDGGFGPTFHDFADYDQVQESATKILGASGPLAGPVLWEGLAQDLAWMAKEENRALGQEAARRLKSAGAPESALCDLRVDGLAAVCDAIRSQEPAAEALLKAFSLIDKLGTKQLRAEALAALPRLLALREHAHPDVSVKARWTVLRLLGVRAGKVSLEDAIKTLAPLMAGEDAELAEAAHAFLTAHTGQRMPKDPKPWLALHERMARGKDSEK